MDPPAVDDYLSNSNLGRRSKDAPAPAPNTPMMEPSSIQIEIRWQSRPSCIMRNESGQPKPSFWAAKEKEASAGDMSFSRIGTVQDVVSSHSSQQRIHRGVGIFSVSMEIEGTANFKPSPRMGDEANLCFNLVSFRTWGTTDGVAPIVHAPRKWY
eukprot:scaffold2293_cov81-Skeletonema_dohrnii-CCMP3373.AAC.11